jgi:hypothetical protein
MRTDKERPHGRIEEALRMKLLMFEHCSLYFRARMAAGLKSFPRRVRDYFEAMMSRIGFEPLPAV